LHAGPRLTGLLAAEIMNRRCLDLPSETRAPARRSSPCSPAAGPGRARPAEVCPMRWLFRPTNLVLLSGALAPVAAGLVVFSFGERAAANRVVPRPVPAGDQEIVFLTGATTAGWERFVASVQRLKADRPDLGLTITDSDAFPSQTTAVPELAVTARGA